MMTTATTNPSETAPLEGLRPLIWLHRKRLVYQVSYWLRALGYDTSDKSFSHRVYGWYLLGFGIFWVYTMWAVALNTISGIGTFFPLEAQANLGSGYPWLVAFLQLYLIVNALRSSPLKLRFEDMEHVAGTPISRGAVVLVRYVWTLVPRAAIASAVAALAIMATTWRLGSEEVAGLAGLQAIALMIPLTAATWSFAWFLGLLRLAYERFERWRMVLWLVPLAFFGLCVFVPGIGLLPGRLLLTAADNAVNWAAVVALTLVAIGFTAILVWIGRRVDLIRVSDESYLHARMVEIGVLSLTEPQLVQQARRQISLAQRRNIRPLPDVSGRWMLAARAGAFYTRRPMTLITLMIWGAAVTQAAVLLFFSGISIPLELWAVAAALVIWTAPRSLTQVFDLDMGESFLRRLIPRSNLQILIADALVPVGFLVMGASLMWLIQPLNPFDLLIGLAAILAFVVLLLLCRGVSKVRLGTAWPSRLEFIPTALVSFGVVLLIGLWFGSGLAAVVTALVMSAILAGLLEGSL